MEIPVIDNLIVSRRTFFSMEEDYAVNEMFADVNTSDSCMNGIGGSSSRLEQYAEYCGHSF